MLLFFNACDFVQSDKEAQRKAQEQQKAFQEKIANAKEVQLKKIDAQKEQELARINSQTTLATLEKKQLLEKIKLEAQAEKEKILLAQAKERELFEAKQKDLQRQDAMEIKRYLILMLFLLLLVIAFLLYHYFKRRHEDKLRAYQDNLDKYFHQQENMTKMRIAEKIIDTVASGKLAKEQESELIKALSGNISPSNEVKFLSDDTAEDAQIIDEDK